LVVDVISDCQLHTDHCTVRWQRAPGVMLRKESVEMTPEDGTASVLVKSLVQ